MNTKEARKYKCSVHSEDYGDGYVEFVSEFREFPNIIGAGETEEEAINEGYENLQVYLDYCKDEKINYPKPID